jgi:hypothetical protein
MSVYYYYICNEQNDEWFKEMMNALKIKYLKMKIPLFDKKYSFILVLNENREMFDKLVMAEVFLRLPLYAFTPISKDI